MNELERLRAETQQNDAQFKSMNTQRVALVEENLLLRADVERLRGALLETRTAIGVMGPMMAQMIEESPDSGDFDRSTAKAVRERMEKAKKDADAALAETKPASMHRNTAHGIERMPLVTDFILPKGLEDVLKRIVLNGWDRPLGERLMDDLAAEIPDSMMKRQMVPDPHPEYLRGLDESAKVADIALPDGRIGRAIRALAKEKK